MAAPLGPWKKLLQSDAASSLDESTYEEIAQLMVNNKCATPEAAKGVPPEDASKLDGFDKLSIAAKAALRRALSRVNAAAQIEAKNSSSGNSWTELAIWGGKSLISLGVAEAGKELCGLANHEVHLHADVTGSAERVSDFCVDALINGAAHKVGDSINSCLPTGASSHTTTSASVQPLEHDHLGATTSDACKEQTQMRTKDELHAETRDAALVHEKEELRRARNGDLYSFSEFISYYGEGRGKSMWHEAGLVIPEAGIAQMAAIKEHMERMVDLASSCNASEDETKAASAGSLSSSSSQDLHGETMETGIGCDEVPIEVPSPRTQVLKDLKQAGWTAKQLAPMIQAGFTLDELKELMS